VIRRTNISPWAFLSPFLVISAVFLVYPFLWATVLAFHQTSGALHSVFVGWGNFQFVLTDPEFYRALRNTTIFAVASVCLQLPISLGLAMLLNSRRDRWKNIFRLILFSPHLVGPIFVGILFTVLFTARYGLVNRFIQTAVGSGLEMQWLHDPALVMPALILTSMWMYVGFNMIYFLAGLQNVPADLLDAARVDGAGPWDRFQHVTLPAIKPVALFVLIMSTIGSFQLFELPYAMLRGTGGPDNAGLTVVMYLYQHAFETGDLGTGAAVGWILSLIIFSISLAQIQLTKGLG
jgi:ABC-type sugar transport system permease subunit